MQRTNREKKRKKRNSFNNVSFTVPFNISLTKVSIFDCRFGGTNSYFLLYPGGKAGGELGFRSVRATYFCRVQSYGSLHHGTLVTALRYYADERGDESAAATAQRAQFLEESANEDASRALLLPMFQK